MNLGNELSGIANCPHCGNASPYFPRVNIFQLIGTDGKGKRAWGIFNCSSCGGAILAKGANEKTNAPVLAIYPSPWIADDGVPERAGRYLQQASKTLSAPDASVLMSAASIDAMLKDQSLTEGSLFKRIDQAVEIGILTKGMAEWAHQTRIDANNPRHADEETPHLDQNDALRAFDFAKAIAEILYVLPKRIPQR